MAAKQMMFETDARAEIAAGLSQLARAVKATLGPRGRNVVLQKSFGSPRITKDGVTVAKEIELPQPFENMGAKLVNMVASKTGDVAGDGTTTATVLAEAIYLEGLKYVTAGGVNPVLIQRGITQGRRESPPMRSPPCPRRSKAAKTTSASPPSAPTAMSRSAT